MFARLAARAAAAAERRAEARADSLAEELAAELPPGISVRRTPYGLEMKGRGIARRFALEPALRWLIGRMR